MHPLFTSFYFAHALHTLYTTELLPDVFIESYRFVPFFGKIRAVVSMSHTHARSRDKELRILIFFPFGIIMIVIRIVVVAIVILVVVVVLVVVTLYPYNCCRCTPVHYCMAVWLCAYTPIGFVHTQNCKRNNFWFVCHRLCGISRIYLFFIDTSSGRTGSMEMVRERR